MEGDIVGDAAGDALLEEDTPWQRRDTAKKTIVCRQPMLELETPKQGLHLVEGSMKKQVHP